MNNQSQTLTNVDLYFKRILWALSIIGVLIAGASAFSSWKGAEVKKSAELTIAGEKAQEAIKEIKNLKEADRLLNNEINEVTTKVEVIENALNYIEDSNKEMLESLKCIQSDIKSLRKTR